MGVSFSLPHSHPLVRFHFPADINSDLSPPTRPPNSHQTIKKDEFYALLSVADLGVITPLRDGMNTTSMEFVLAQEKTNRSPLILSEFMGISSNMTDALQINPWNLGVRFVQSLFLCDGG